MIGQTLSHYNILEKLGEGGMGIVYKAQDTKLDRLVALKFLPHHLTASEAEQARFLQEAKAASALNHPNVCSIHSVGEHAGQSFIDMEFVEGQTLRAKVAGGPLKLEDAIQYAIQIGEALHEAHSKGIVHRDIKCENIMINTRNQVKVMDFGIAKLKGALKLTKTSSTVGTLAYMSPEQIQGGEIDGRSDIFSFGVVLFETLTGRLPFRGEHDSAMIYSILNEEPEPIQKFLPDLSPEFLHIINRSLEKKPENRYQSASEMVIDLQRVKKQSARVSRTTLGSPTQPSASGKTPKKRLHLALGVITVIVIGIAVAVFLPDHQRVLYFHVFSDCPDVAFQLSDQIDTTRYRLSLLPDSMREMIDQQLLAALVSSCSPEYRVLPYTDFVKSMAKAGRSAPKPTNDYEFLDSFRTSIILFNIVAITPPLENNTLAVMIRGRWNWSEESGSGANIWNSQKTWSAHDIFNSARAELSSQVINFKQSLIGKRAFVKSTDEERILLSIPDRSVVQEGMILDAWREYNKERIIRDLRDGIAYCEQHPQFKTRVDALQQRLNREMETRRDNEEWGEGLGIQVRITGIFDTTALGTVFGEHEPWQQLMVGDYLEFIP